MVPLFESMDRQELLLRPVAHMHPEGILAGLSDADAMRHLPGVAHNIVEIVAHMGFWQDWFLQRCSGIAVPPVAHAADGWPPVIGTDWARMRDAFFEGMHRAAQHPAKGKVEPPLEYELFAHYDVEDVMIHLAQHNAHHLGQIVIIRQALALWPPPGGSYTW